MVFFRATLLTVGLAVLAAWPTADAQPVDWMLPQDPPVTVTFFETPGRLRLTGSLYRPTGTGPFPALVLMHGCGGITSNVRRWADVLRRWGYVAMVVDSLGPRGRGGICDDPIGVDARFARMPDAYAAQSFLATQSFVDKQRIAVIGWSHGGSTVLFAVDAIYLADIPSPPFKAAIAFYPGCVPLLQRVNAPLLILIGEDDDWTPASQCRAMVRRSAQWEARTTLEIKLEVYPGAHHSFDALLPPRHFFGHELRYHPEAAARAEEEVRDFLARYVGVATR